MNTLTTTETMEIVDEGAMSDTSSDLDSRASSPDPDYQEGNLLTEAMENEVTAQLVAAGVVGVAAAAAITSSKKRKRPHSFETNPSIRKRQQNRLLRKLRQTIFEYATRVGQQAVVLVATPGKPNNIYKVFGAKPLEDVIKNLRNMVMDELETALAQQAPPKVQDDPSLFELPPLIIDGIPTPVEKMTQAQLRAFIPLMLKYSTGRGKPGWGRDSTRPEWWPKELPWANVRMDARTEEEKQKISWTHALRKIVINCYKYHGREDLLPAFSEEDEKANAIATANANYQTVLQTNGDGTFSLIQVDPSTLTNNPSIITLPDGTTAQVQGVATLHTQSDGTTVHTVQMDGQSENMQVDLSEALAQDGQLIITNEDGNVFPVGISGMITLPVTAQMYHSLVQQQIPNNDNTVCVTPMQVQNFISNNTLCGSIANSNLNSPATSSSTTYLMSANRNVINLPIQSSPVMKSMEKNFYLPQQQKNRTIIKKSYLKKKLINLAMAKPKKIVASSSSQTDFIVCKQTTSSGSSNNNNSTNVRDKNQKKVSNNLSKVERPEPSQNKDNSLIDDSDGVKMKEEQQEKIEEAAVDAE
ncbi:CLUMA_CG000717, isoform B [Clunio marinus]|uniref:CLUMA_CG000717, isoform B n=1 Tax=Clunio marinus TaxID=568069 RepID=A0A1J1HKA6_9DIPT|nr:CLUMA_CG000717, isoform B [Clunio marinus]